VGNESKQIQFPNKYWRINDDSLEMQLKNPNGEDTVKDKESFECTLYRTAQISFGSIKQQQTERRMVNFGENIKKNLTINIYVHVDHD
jgi:hypothetical protein